MDFTVDALTELVKIVEAGIDHAKLRRDEAPDYHSIQDHADALIRLRDLRDALYSVIDNNDVNYLPRR